MNKVQPVNSISFVSKGKLLGKQVREQLKKVGGISDTKIGFADFLNKAMEERNGLQNNKSISSRLER